MNQTDAYRILNLPDGSSKEQVQEQFSRLVLQYKPDEHPAEFMKIHTAYKLLMQDSAQADSTFLQTDTGPSDIIFDEWEDEFQKLDETFDTEEARIRKEQFRKEQLEAKERLINRKKTALAITEKLEQLRQLLALEENKKNFKPLKEFFVQEELRPLLLEPDWMNGIQSLLAEKKVCNKYINVIYRAYDFYTEPQTVEMQRRIEMRSYLLDKRYRAPDLPAGPFRWKIWIPLLLLLIAMNAINDLTLIDQLVHCGFYCAFLLIERFFRQVLHKRRLTSYVIGMLPAVILGLWYTNSFSDPSAADYNWLMTLWCYWFDIAFIIGLIAGGKGYFRFLHIHEQKG